MAATYCQTLLTQTQPGDGCPVSLDIVLAQIGKEASSPANHLQQSASGVMIVTILAKVIRQLVDSLGQECDLNFRGSRVSFVQTKSGNDLLLLYCL